MKHWPMVRGILAEQDVGSTFQGMRCVVSDSVYVTYRSFDKPEGKFRKIASEKARNGDHYQVLGVKKGNKTRRICVIKGNKFYRLKSLRDTKPEKGG